MWVQTLTPAGAAAAARVANATARLTRLRVTMGLPNIGRLPNARDLTPGGTAAQGRRGLPARPGLPRPAPRGGASAERPHSPARTPSGPRRRPREDPIARSAG